MPWPQACDFPPVAEASFLVIEGLPEQEPPPHPATSFGLARALLEHGEEQGAQGMVEQSESHLPNLL